MVPAARTVEVDQLAAAEPGDQAVLRLLVDLLPGLVGDRGVTPQKVTDVAATLLVDTKVCDVGRVLAEITASGGVADITVSDPPMEEIIEEIFRKEGAGA